MIRVSPQPRGAGRAPAPGAPAPRAVVRRTCLVAVLVAAGACSRSEPPVRGPVARARVVATIQGVVDSDGNLVIETAPAGPPNALVTVPVVQDGRPGSGPPNTVELVTERTASVPGGCGSANGYEGDVRLRSFYPGYHLQNAYAEIISVTPTGHEACNSAPAVPGVSNQYGLFSYGTLTQAGTPGDSAVATWRFRRPDAQGFTFTGRIVADLADVAPPVTTASLADGWYGTPQVVTLGCADAGSGCAATYYQENTRPTTASPRYTGPLLVEKPTYLWFFSVDAAGNAEAPKAAFWGVDTTPPTVVSVTPHPKQGDVPVTTTVTISFDDPMEQASIPDAVSLVGPAGPVAGSVSLTDRWTFTPLTPLDPATRYTVHVSTAARNMAGLPLTTPYSSWFLTPTPTFVASEPASAAYAAPVVAQDAFGNRLAVFTASTLVGSKLLWSYFDAAAGTWTAEQALLTYRSPLAPGAPIEAKVASNGTTFLVAWRDPEYGYLHRVIFAAGVPGVVDEGLGAGAVAPGFGLASNGGGYAIATATDPLFGDVVIAVHDGFSWGGGGVIPSASAPAIAPFGASSYVVAYRADGPFISTRRYDASTSTWVEARVTDWSAPVIEGLLAPALATSGTRVCVTWGTTTGAIMAAVDPGTGAFDPSVDLSGGTGEPASALAAAANGARFAVVWNDATTSGAYAATFEAPGQAWTPATHLTGRTGNVTSATVVPAGDGFLTALRITEAAGVPAPAHAWVNKDVPGSGFTAAGETLAESWAGDVRDVGASGAPGLPAILAWARDDGTAMGVETRTHDGAALGPPATVSLPGVPGSAAWVRLAANASGEVVAAWHQDERGSTAVFAAVRRAGVWEAPVRLAWRAREPEIASNGTGFALLYRDLGAGSDATLAAVEYTSGAWSSPEVIESNATSHAIASDGTTYGAVWLAPGGPGGPPVEQHVAIRGSSGWSQPAPIYGGYYTPRRPAIAGRPAPPLGDYAVAWYDETPWGAFQVFARLASVTDVAGAWTWPPESLVGTGLNARDAGLPPPLAASTSGYVTYSDGVGLVFSWGTASPWGSLELSGGAVDDVAAAESSYLAASACPDVRFLLGQAGAWRRVPWDVLPWSMSSAYDLTVASDGADYKVVARSASWGIDADWVQVEQADVVGGVAYTSQVLARGPDLVTVPRGTGIAVVHDGTDWVGVWTRPPADPVADQVEVRTGF